MKKALKTKLVLFTALAAILLQMGAGSSKRLHSSLISKLTTHRWTLTERIETTGKVSVDLTEMQTSAERGRVLVYREDGTYVVLEAEAGNSGKAEQVAAEGTWSIDEQGMILNDRYSGGSKIERKIMVLDDETYVLQHRGEGNKEIKETYVSEQALKKDEFGSINLPEGKMARKIGDLLNAYLEETDHYNLVLKKDIEHDGKVRIDESDTARKTVLMWPLLDRQDTLSTATRQQALFAIAAKHRVRYVLTGRITELKTYTSGDNIKAKLRYQLNVLDTAGSKTASYLFQGESGSANARGGGGILGALRKAPDILGRAGDVLGATSGWLGTAGILMQRQQLLLACWKTALTAQALSDRSNQYRMMFSSIPEKERQKVQDSAAAVNEALAATLENVEAFVTSTLVYDIKIYGLEGSGNNARLVIGAGNNIRLKENETLQLVQLMPGGTEGQYTQKVIGTLVVTATDPGDYAKAWCGEKGKKSKVIDAYEDAADKNSFVVRTMRQDSGKKE